MSIKRWVFGLVSVDLNPGPGEDFSLKLTTKDLPDQIFISAQYCDVACQITRRKLREQVSRHTKNSPAHDK
jgi:hypothetical protein